MKPLVILRPEPGASRTAAAAEALGLAARKVPLFAIAPVEWTAPDPKDFDALVFTSANAVRHAGAQLARLTTLPVYAVGEATAALAAETGFKIATVGDGGARQMQLPQGQRLLHLAGRDHLPIAGAVTMKVYEALPTEHPAGIDTLDDCVVAVHSARAGARLAELIAERSRTAIAALSPAAAAASGDGWLTVQAAAEPSDAALLALAARLCKSHAQ